MSAQSEVERLKEVIIRLRAVIVEVEHDPNAHLIRANLRNAKTLADKALGREQPND